MAKPSSPANLASAIICFFASKKFPHRLKASPGRSQFWPYVSSRKGGVVLAEVLLADSRFTRPDMGFHPTKLNFVPSDADEAPLDVSICLHAFGIVGCGSFSGVKSCEPSAGNARGRCLVINGCYLVDPASSHMLVSKIKPCMYKRSTQALPVALMIHDNSSDRTAFVPATHHSNFCPINFRCWTLGWVDRSASGVHRSARPFCRRCAPVLNWPGRASGAVTLKKLECSKQAYALRTTAKAFAKDVFINQERKLGARRRSDTVLVSTINDADQGSADVAFRTPLAPYEKSKSLGSGGSMVARLKLKGIDGRAPPGVEPAA
ncbi:hypothetical protein JHK87_034949 [Glycine soja]|nr:hypothetical protein JHK87_034949 [Glycine soja]